MANILIIEDETTLRETVADVLSLNHHQITTAGDGYEGVIKAREIRPDVIICDVMMPGMNGLEVLSQLRREQIFQLTPFIFLTAKAGREDVRKGMNLGGDDYLTKPFQNEELLKSVKTQLEKYSRKRAMFHELENFLEERNRQLQQYSFINSHKVRGPLANIMGLVDLMKQDPELRDHSLVHHLATSAGQLDRIIKDLNDMLSVESFGGKILDEDNSSMLSKVMLVDDDEIHHLVTEHLIRRIMPDAEVVSFLHPEEALAHLLHHRQNLPKLILLDINMPVMNGFAFLEALKREHLHLPVQMLTSSLDPNDVERARSYLCVQGFISKPLTLEKLAHSVPA
ncbi:MAG: response regulator [Bacteroidota bacterium]